MMMAPTPSLLAAAGFDAAALPMRQRQRDVRSDADGLLGVANRTWLDFAGPSLDVLLLVDCSSYCRNMTLASSREAQAAAAGVSAACGSSQTRLPKRVPSGVYDEHHPFGFPRPSWMTLRPNLHLRCYWGHYTSFGTLPRNVRKGAALQRAMLDVLPSKRFYMKMDMDALLDPKALLQLLRFVESAVHPASPVYMGSTYVGKNRSTWDFGFDEPRAQMVYNGTWRAAHRRASWATKMASKVFLRETLTWRKLEAQHLTPAQQSGAKGGAVHFAAGGMFGLSRTALQRLVNSSCMQKVAELKCQPSCRRSELQQIEDSVIGLCMHLLRVRLLDTPCFVTYLTFEKPPPVRLARRESCRRLVSLHPLKELHWYAREWVAMRTPERRTPIEPHVSATR